MEQADRVRPTGDSYQQALPTQIMPLNKTPYPLFNCAAL
jgi:hypothetical protein